MKTLVFALVVCIVGSVLSGCTSCNTFGDNSALVSSPVDNCPERTHRHSNIADLQTRMLVEDWDKLWLLDRSTKLTYWHAFYGY